MDKSEKFIGWGLFLSLFGLLAFMSAAKYLTLHSTFFDLGIYLNRFSKIDSGNWSLAFFTHAHPLVWFWSLLYKVFPESVTPVLILIMQALFLSWPVVVLYRIYGIIPAAAFFLYFPLWYNALFDFHIDHMAVGFIFGFFFLVRIRKIWGAVVMALLLALVKEPFALQTVACGLYLLCIKKIRLPGVILIIFGILYFVAVMQYLIPYFSFDQKGGVGAASYAWLGNPNSLLDMVGYILLNPLKVLVGIFSNNQKLLFLASIFGALGFISLLRPGILLVALPIICMSLLSDLDEHFSFTTHYTAGIIAPLIIAFAEGLQSFKQLWIKMGLSIKYVSPLLLTGLIGCHILASPSPFSQIFWVEYSWHYHVSSYLPDERNGMIKNAISEYVPSDKAISVTELNSVNWGPLVHRRHVFSFPEGVLEPVKVYLRPARDLSGLLEMIISGNVDPLRGEYIRSDYVVIDLKRAWFDLVKGCEWENGKCQDDQAGKEFLEIVKKAKEFYEIVYENDGFFIMKRI